MRVLRPGGRHRADEHHPIGQAAAQSNLGNRRRGAHHARRPHQPGPPGSGRGKAAL